MGTSYYQPPNFNLILSIAINCVNYKSIQLKEQSDYFLFLDDDVKLLKYVTDEDSLKHYKHLQLLLADRDSVDIN